MRSSFGVVLGACFGLVVGCGQSQASDSPSGSAGAASADGGGAGSSAAGSGLNGGGGEPAAPAAGAAGDDAAGGSSGAAGSSGGDAGSGSEPITVQAILDSYHGFTPQTPAPVSVSGYIFGLCRLPTLRENEFLASIHGDGRYLRDWANAAAVQGLATRGVPAFAEGAVIVKEKYAGPQSSEADLVAIGLMIKRAPGFDPAHGDWDYAYYEPALGIVHDAEQTVYCHQCHAGAAATDFVFVDGLKP